MWRGLRTRQRGIVLLGAIMLDIDGFKVCRRLKGQSGRAA
jgi:DNA-binding response OmpR family regulator